MSNDQAGRMLIALFSLWAVSLEPARSQNPAVPRKVQVHVVITDAALSKDKEVPPLRREDVKVKRDRSSLPVTQLIPAQGDNAALQLMILIDDTLDRSVGNNLNDLREFMAAQPPSALIGVSYMSNATVNVVQNFTPDHALAVQAVRLPRGSLSAMDSPYLSLISLVRGWPQQKVRRVVLMVSDGIDRLRGERPRRSGRGARFGPTFHSMPSLSIDATSASEISQRYNVIVFSLYSPGVGRAGRSSWDLQIGLSGLTKLAEETGGEAFSLGTSPLVSFKPFLDRLQNMLSNQYYVVFQAVPGNRPGLQRIRIETELSNSEILAPDNVWVPVAE